MNDELLTWVLAVHACCALFMAGLIWFVQVVHYPLFDKIGKAEFTAYEQQHVRRTGWVVIGPMLLEAGLAAVLAWSPGGWQAWCGLALLAIIWLSTFLSQVPNHAILERGFDKNAHRRLVRGNWVRTAGWSLRGVLAMVMLATHGMAIGR
jgi:hypothetical protein